MNLNLIRLFDFYLAALFLLSTYMRYQQYEAIIRLVRALPDRWPRLLGLIREHHAIFLTWETVFPGLVALGLTLMNMLACRLIWPHASVTVATLVSSGVVSGEITGHTPQHSSLTPHPSPLTFLVLALGLAMLCVDLYATFKVGHVDRVQLESYFDQAEYWLRSWVTPVVHIFTLGYINPRKMVSGEVRKALVQASKQLNTTLWWVSLQVTLRIAYGLSLWLSFAIRS